MCGRESTKVTSSPGSNSARQRGQIKESLADVLNLFRRRCSLQPGHMAFSAAVSCLRGFTVAFASGVPQPPQMEPEEWTGVPGPQMRQLNVLINHCPCRNQTVGRCAHASNLRCLPLSVRRFAHTGLRCRQLPAGTNPDRPPAAWRDARHYDQGHVRTMRPASQSYTAHGSIGLQVRYPWRSNRTSSRGCSERTPAGLQF